MNKNRFHFLLLGFLCLMQFSYAAPTIAGKWITIDDDTHKPRSVVTIWQSQNKWYARLDKIYYRAGEGPKDVCKLCSGSEKDKPILGMIFVKGMQGNLPHLAGGTILDPHNVKNYRCVMDLSPKGNTLTVRGYIGMPLFGRSQVWQRQQG
jgi:uncharacterized protein (DUF2147 family)